MQLMIKDMNEEYAVQALNWKYDSPYDFYNSEASSSSIKNFLDGSYYAVFDEHNDLVGVFCYGIIAQVPIGNSYGAYTEKRIDIGLGMKPNLTGQGNGYAFFSFILNHIQKIFPSMPMRLTVAEFNERAIHLYEKFGFSKKMKFQRDSTTFITMIKDSTKGGL